MKSKVRAFAFKLRQGTEKEDGQGLVEYGLILTLIAVVCAAALSGLQGAIDACYDTIASVFP